MKIKIKFGIPYSVFTGVNEVEFSQDRPKVTLKDLFNELFIKYPNFKEKLAIINLIQNDTLWALVVINNILITNTNAWLDTEIADGAEIKILMPYSGG